MKRSTTLLGLLLAIGAVGVGLLWWLGREGTDPAPEVEPVRTPEAAPPALDTGAGRLPTPTGDAGPVAVPVDPGAALRAEAADFEGAIEGWLVAEGSRIPLVGWTVEAHPVGRPRGADVPEAERWTSVTDADGGFTLEGLDRQGPWELWAEGVGAGFIDPYQGRYRVTGQRVGTLMASPGGQADPKEYPAKVGPLIRLRAALPEAYGPGDLLFTARCDVSPFSSGLSNLGGAATGASWDEGSAQGVLPVISNSMREPRGTVSVRTRDGLFGLAVRVEAGLDNGEVCTLDGPLEPTGRVRIRTDPPEAVDWPDVRARIVFSLRSPGGERATPDLLTSPEEGVIEIPGIPPGDWTVGADPPDPDAERKPEWHVPLQAVRSTRDADPVPTTVRVIRWH